MDGIFALEIDMTMPELNEEKPIYAPTVATSVSDDIP